MFTKEQRSSFPYWFAHWCAFQMTALNLGAWKFKYLFHDIEKPFLKLIWGDYKRVQKWHRYHNNHHLQYKNPDKIDWETLIIDWECSRFTKTASPRTAREEMETYKPIGPKKEDFSNNIEYLSHLSSYLAEKSYYEWMEKNMRPILDRLKI